MLAGLGLVLTGNVLADTPTHCPVTYQQLERALRESVHASGGPENGGLPVNEWAAVVDRAGAVCAVARSGAKAGDQWLGSHAVAVEKADTANAFDLDSHLDGESLGSIAARGLPLRRQCQQSGSRGRSLCRTDITLGDANRSPGG